MSQEKHFEETENGYYIEDFYFDKDGYLMQTMFLEGVADGYVGDLYYWHGEYHKHISDVNYVPVGSVLGCTYGSILAKLTADEAA